MTNDEIQAKLAEPFITRLEDGAEVPDLKWRVIHTFQDKEGNNYAEYSPYITAPQVRDRLNEVLGVFAWECSFEEMSSDKGMICNLTVTGNSKSAIGSCFGRPPEIDPDKTKESDSMKRAAMAFGIGAYTKNIKPVTLKVKKQSGKIACAFSTDGKTELYTADQINAYLNQIPLPILKFNEALKGLQKDVIEANKKEIEIVWKLLKNS